MPTTRSETSRSRTIRTGETTTTATTAETIASRDWSMQTPTETITSATAETTTTRSTMTKRTPPPSVGGDRCVTVPTAGTCASLDTIIPADVTFVAPLAIPRARREESPPRKEKHTSPQINKSTTNMDMRSITSSHKRRTEANAKIELAQRELEAAQAKLRLMQIEAISDSEDEDHHLQAYEKTREVEEWLNRTEERTGRHRRDQQEKRKEKRTEIQELAHAIAKLSHRDPDSAAIRYTELPYFSGACEEWLAFKRTYEDTASSLSNAHNLARLRRAVQGRAKEAVQSLLFTAEDPREVISGLEARFGRPGALALSELEKLKNLPRVNENPSEICVFASKVRNAVATIKALRKPQYLSSPETLKAIIEKMPSSMKFRWFAYHRDKREEGIQELILVDSYLQIEADMCGDFAPPEVQWEPKRLQRPIVAAESSWDRKKTVRKPVHALQESHEKGITCLACQGEHFTDKCEKYRAATSDSKWEIIKKSRVCFKCLRPGHSKLNCRAPACKKCARWHHTSLHTDAPTAPIEKKEDNKPCYSMRRDTEFAGSQEKIASIHTTVSEGKAYLKMIPVDLYGPRGRARVLALLDEGSTVTLLDSAVAEQIGCKGKEETLTIETMGGRQIKKSSQRINMKIKGAHRRDKKNIEARTIEHLKLSEQEIREKTLEGCEHLRDIKEQLIYAREKPKLLIGQDNWSLIVTRKLKKGKSADPVASLTSLGWVLHGCETGIPAVVNFVNYCDTREDDVERIVKQHFKIESLGVEARLPSNDSDRRALETLEQTTRKITDNRYETGLLWKNENEVLPNNYSQARRRLICIEKKLRQDKDLKEEYSKQMKNLLDSGYAEKAPSTTTTGRTFYLPHFAVVHPVKRKPRIVFDAAAKFEGKSLNDVLIPGPDLLQSLFGVLLRFREGPVAVIADIKEMFLQIKIRQADRDSQRFLWRENEDQKPEEYRMTSVIFGAASSPATAIYVMRKNAEKYKETHAEAVKAIERNHYMDDYLQSFSTKEDAKRVAIEVRNIHEQANFHLKGWASNDETAVEEFKEKNENDCVEIANEEKTLGLRWLVKEDKLAFNIGLRNTSEDLRSGKRTPTKREVTSAIMSTFDPLGLASPVLIQGKKLIQQMWRTKIDWDEEIHEETKIEWTRYLEEVATLAELKVPRCISPHAKTGELHTFTDASEEAYAAAIYWRTIDANGQVSIALIAGKARVTPSKPVSMPRLELQAALLGSRLAATVEKEMDLEVTRRTFWTDSSTVLQWVKSEPRKFKSFVAHRLAEIEDLTAPKEWRWVPTKENPADDATRGTPNEFSHKSRWFQGPAFLQRREEDWPAKRFEQQTGEQLEERITVKVAVTRICEEEAPIIERFSSWQRLLRAMARVVMFIDLLRKKKETKVVNAAHKKEEAWKPFKKDAKKKTSYPEKPKSEEKKMNLLPLEENHLKKAEQYLLRRCQNETFKNDANRLREQKPIEKASRLKKIDVYLSSDDLIKLRSRTRKIAYEGRRTNPVVLDGKHRITRLLIEDYHKRFLHANTATVMNEIRQRYWILSLRTTVKAIIHNCQWCKVRKGAPQIPPTGDLPIERLQHHKYPFTSTAVDYFGPMLVTVGRRTEKRWGALFTCLTTRAVHLELVPSLSTSSMIMALRRMAARRGMPKTIFSDNGTNFVGANRELEEAAAEKGIKWKFIPPGSPNMGGAWERLVRSVKTALAAVLNERSPPEEVLYTLMTEVEHVVNSRPLTHLSMDPADEECLTPNHFLLGRSCGVTPTDELTDRELIGRTTWKTAQVLTDHFWKRWLREYLPTLMPRKVSGRDTTDPKEGDIVLIVDAALPRNTWPRGKVVNTYPGPDGRTRILDVSTPGGVLRRPSRRVIVLVPAESSLQRMECNALRGRL